MRIEVCVGARCARGCRLAGVAIGADDPIKERQRLMKKNGAAAKIAVRHDPGARRLSTPPRPPRR